MSDYKELIADLTAAANRNSNSLNTRYTCRKAADAIEQLVKERDAAVADLRRTNPCIVCKHFSEGNCGCDAFYECAVGENDLWEWRGVTDE